MTSASSSAESAAPVLPTASATSFGARFGFDIEPRRLVDIGEQLGVSAGRVRQIEERALSKLRQTG